MKRKALGRGLEALIPGLKTGTEEERGLLQIPVSMIKPSRHQPRREFDKGKLKDLAESIKEKGMIQPVIVQRLKEGYELIAGERRWRAVQMLGIEKVPALIKELSSPEMLEMALIENIQRENLNPIEEALAYNKLIKGFKMTQEELSRRVGKDRTSVTNTLRLLRLPEAIRRDIASNRISTGHARALLSLRTEGEQKTLRDMIVKRGLSVRETERMVKRAQKTLAKRKKTKRDIFLLSIEEDLKRRLNTKVHIKTAKRGGKIEIHYYSDAELQRILEEIKKGEEA